jgi:hypothetical protein
MGLSSAMMAVVVEIMIHVLQKAHRLARRIVQMINRQDIIGQVRKSL